MNAETQAHTRKDDKPAMVVVSSFHTEGDPRYAIEAIYYTKDGTEAGVDYYMDAHAGGSVAVNMILTKHDHTVMYMQGGDHQVTKADFINKLTMVSQTKIERMARK